MLTQELREAARREAAKLSPVERKVAEVFAKRAGLGCAYTLLCVEIARHGDAARKDAHAWLDATGIALTGHGPWPGALAALLYVPEPLRASLLAFRDAAKASVEYGRAVRALNERVSAALPRRPHLSVVPSAHAPTVALGGPTGEVRS